ncbi:hypothetical protein Lal_00013063 [Lupinus albus]|nr:hypothetical protein Lal_00013063 [Lupinus albus]
MVSIRTAKSHHRSHQLAQNARQGPYPTGRFDRHVNVELPDVRGRIAILKHHAKKIKVGPDVDLEAIAARCPGRSGAELENMLNVAALRASRAKASVVRKQDMEWAYDRVTMGSERKSMVVTEKEKEMTAYHEAGHALVQLFDKESSNTLYKYSYTAAEYMSNIRVALGGKMAEELRYGDDRVTSGVSSVSFNEGEAITNIYSFLLGSRESHRLELHDGDTLWHV